MIKCPFCQTAYVDNTVFCSECGNYLLKDDIRETDQWDIGITDMVVDGIDEFRVPLPPQPGTKVLAIRLKIGARKREVEMLLDKAITIGRVAPASNVFPEIDLSDDDASAKRISRRHARILKQRGAVVVEDLESANGTFINGKKLAPYLPETLTDGDTLQLGSLLIEVKILTSR